VGKTIKIVFAVLLIISSLILFTAGIAQKQQIPVTVTVGDHEIIWKTTMNTVSSCLYELGIVVNPQDDVYPSLEASITPNMEITIIRNFDILISDGIVDRGVDKVYTVAAKTVRGALDELGITLDAPDTVYPSLDSQIGRGSKLAITRRESFYQTEYEQVPYSSWEFADNRIYEGTFQVWRQGEYGSRAKTYLVQRKNGEVVSKDLVEDKIVSSPKIHVVARGTKPRFYTLKTATGSVLYTKKLNIEATAYYPGPESTGIYADGYTSIGLKAGHGVIAVDPKVIPLGTQVYIPGYGYAIAGDIGGAIKGNIIDLCFDTFREAIQFGRRKVEVYFIADQGRL